MSTGRKYKAPALRTCKALVRLLKRGVKAILRAPGSLASPPRSSPRIEDGIEKPRDLSYPEWLALRVQARSRRLRARPGIGQFSVLTSVYNTPPQFLEALAASLFGQTQPVFEWVLLDNGSTNHEVSEVVRKIAQDDRVRSWRVEQNQGVLGGMRLCLERARGRYVIPVDSDDMLLPDALHVLAQVIEDHGAPPFLYSDEDQLIEGVPHPPYCRPDWDPVLNFCTSYVFHLCAFDRKMALDLGVYSDDRANWCHDWDTVLRFSAAGVNPCHIPEVLYHWRFHPSSSTNRPDPEKGSLVSQRHVLQRMLDQRPDTQLYDLQPFPISRGCFEWWVRRRHERPDPLLVFLLTESTDSALDALQRLLTEAAYPFCHVHVIGSGPFAAADRQRLINALQALHDQHQTHLDADTCFSFYPRGGLPGLLEATQKLEEGLALIWSDQVRPEGEEWPWEATGLCRLHPDIALISGRILNRDRNVVAGGEIFGFNGILGTPDYGRPATSPGYWAMALKQKTVSAVHSSFFLAEARFLRNALKKLPKSATLPFLGAWLGALATDQNRRVVFTPLVTSAAEGTFTGIQHPGPGEQELFLKLNGRQVPDTRWYSPLFRCDAGAAFQLRNPEEFS